MTPIFIIPDFSLVVILCIGVPLVAVWIYAIYQVRATEALLRSFKTETIVHPKTTPHMKQKLYTAALAAGFTAAIFLINSLAW